MYAEVILHRRLPKGFDSFTYEVPAGLALAAGQFVQVPFKKQSLSGIVRRLHNEKPRYPTRAVEKAAQRSITAKQMELAVWMSQHYQCSFAKTIDLFVPEKIWKI